MLEALASSHEPSDGQWRPSDSCLLFGLAVNLDSLLCFGGPSSLESRVCKGLGLPAQLLGSGGGGVWDFGDSTLMLGFRVTQLQKDAHAMQQTESAGEGSFGRSSIRARQGNSNQGFQPCSQCTLSTIKRSIGFTGPSPYMEVDMQGQVSRPGYLRRPCQKF